MKKKNRGRLNERVVADVTYFETPNDANHRNRHAVVRGIEFFAFPYQAMSCRVGQKTAIVSRDISSQEYVAVIRGGNDAVRAEAHRRFDSQESALHWAARELLKGSGLAK